MANRIITVGRQYGSGGKEIGVELAKRLGIDSYDKELLNLTAKKLGYQEQIVETLDEKPTSSFLYSLVMGMNRSGNYSDSTAQSLQEQVVQGQFQTIRDIAKKESCVMIGRCSDYILREEDRLVRVFICADIEERIRRIMDIQNISSEKAKELIVKEDKKRKSYYNYYTNQMWGGAEYYDLILNVSKTGKDGAVKVILKYMEACE